MKRFVILYLFYILLFFILVDYEPVRKWLHIEEFYNSFITALSAKAIELVGIPVSYSENILHLPHADMVIKFGCNGLEAVLIYLAGVLAYEAGAKVKLLGAVAGIVVLEIINILRIVLLAYVLEYHPDIFDVLHDYITQSIMIILAFILFLIYLQKAGGENQGS